VQVSLYPVPFKPILNKIGADLFSSYAISYQWYKDGNINTRPLHQKKLHLTANAKYKVETTDVNGCKANVK